MFLWRLFVFPEVFSPDVPTFVKIQTAVRNV
jgi:hypothetical protein